MGQIILIKNNKGGVGKSWITLRKYIETKENST